MIEIDVLGFLSSVAYWAGVALLEFWWLVTIILVVASIAGLVYRFADKLN